MPARPIGAKIGLCYPPWYRKIKKYTIDVNFMRFDSFLTGQICTFAPEQQIFRYGYSEQGVLDFIFLWFCPVFVPSGICLTEQNFASNWMISG